MITATRQVVLHQLNLRVHPQLGEQIARKAPFRADWQLRAAAYFFVNYRASRTVVASAGDRETLRAAVGVASSNPTRRLIFATGQGDALHEPPSLTPLLLLMNDGLCGTRHAASPAQEQVSGTETRETTRTNAVPPQLPCLGRSPGGLLSGYPMRLHHGG
jgi:hypothetical protein